MNFKAGDIVKVLPNSWYDFFKDKYGNVWPEKVGIKGSRHFFSKDMAEKCGKSFEIIALLDGAYKVRGMHELLEDWMVESKTFNEVKQETGLNKITKSMETKKMTIAEAQELAKNTKYIVFSANESEHLQKKLFEIGCRWMHSGKTICHTDKPFLTIDEYLNIRCCQKHAYTYFEDHKGRFTETYRILNIEIEREQDRPKPKFDPNTLEVFDKVLVRESKKQIWRAKFYHCQKGEQYYTIDDVIYPICIPYNEDTKHLHGTREDAPEFYKLD
ncbi:MAG: hypothetical protein U0L66_08315 [Acutalibacteraceae bacterium]|nr:hypothetical protein [Acutalibacteraceae bacterium]